MKGILVAITLIYALQNVKAELSFGDERTRALDNITCQYPNEIIPDFDDCSAYYVCGNDDVIQHVMCPPNYSFSNITLTCIYPYDDSQCANTDSTGTPPTTTTAPPQPNCLYKSQILPDTSDCAVYYLCDSNMIPQYFHCSTTLWYDPVYAGCNYIERVNCNNGIRPTPIPTAIPVDGYVGTPPTCDRPADLSGDFADCQYFWKCNSESEPEAFKCPPNLLFDHFTSSCERPEFANCVIVQY